MEWYITSRILHGTYQFGYFRTSDGQITFSSDSESVDEDYNADEEMSEGEEEEEMDDEEIDDVGSKYLMY